MKKFKCKHCGHIHEGDEASAKSLKFCQECGKPWEYEEVKDVDDAAQTGDVVSQVKGVITDALKGVKAAIKSVQDKQEEQDTRLKKIEALPATKTVSVKMSSGEKYKGYKLSHAGTKGQNLLFGGSSLKSFCMKNKEEFEVLGTEEGFEEFSKFMIDVKDALMGDVDARQKLQTAQKASEMVEGTTSLGGYTVPVEYQNDLIRLAKENSFALQECSILEMSSQTLPIPTELTRVSVNWPNEAAAPTESNATFSQVMLTAKKLAGLTDGISKELLADSAIDIVGLLTEQFMYAIAQELDNQVLNGTGSPCSGVLTAAAGYSVVMAADAFSTITADNLSEMIYKLAEEDAANAKFIYNRLIQHYIRTKKDTSGQYIWQRPAEGRPGTIWETPYIQSSKVTGTTGASTAFVALGNWKKFYLGRRQGQMALDVDPYQGFGEDMVRFKMVTRWAAAIARATAFVRLLTSA